LKGGKPPDRFRRRRGGNGRSIFGEDWPTAKGRLWAIETVKQTFNERSCADEALDLS
jgi:hypothetical protein